MLIVYKNNREKQLFDFLNFETVIEGGKGSEKFTSRPVNLQTMLMKDP